jgi:uncharacterized Zn finger protein
MRIVLTCDRCGKNRFAFPEGGGDDAIVSCEECGHIIGSMGALKQAVAEAVVSKTRTLKIRGVNEANDQ